MKESRKPVNGYLSQDKPTVRKVLAVTAVNMWSSRFHGLLEYLIYPRIPKETRTKVSARAVMTAIRPP